MGRLIKRSIMLLFGRSGAGGSTGSSGGSTPDNALQAYNDDFIITNLDEYIGLN